MNLKEEQRRYKVFVDESFDAEKDTESRKDKWRYYELRGPRHIVYAISDSRLGLYMQTALTEHREFKYEGWELLRDGDDEVVWSLPNRDWEIAAKLAKAYKRRILSESEKNRLATYGFKKKSNALANATEEKEGHTTPKTKNHTAGGV